MKGRASAGAKILLLTIFAASFLTGAIVTFGIASLSGKALVYSGVSFEWRLVIAAAISFSLAVFDVLALRRRDYCLLGMRRQTPQSLTHRAGTLAGIALWGFDTGLAVTTFRVAAITWAPLALAFLGFASWLVGVAYGMAFVTGLILMMTRFAGIEHLTAMLASRPIVQRASALTLFFCGVALLVRLSV